MYFSFGNLIMGLIGLVVGVFMIAKAYYLNHHVLFLDWAEQKWGGGGGTKAYRVIGLIVCVFSVFVMFGWIDVFGTSFGSRNTSSDNQNIRINIPENTGGRIAD